MTRQVYPFPQFRENTRATSSQPLGADNTAAGYLNITNPP
jgi:hypothetical protein